MSTSDSHRLQIIIAMLNTAEIKHDPEWEQQRLVREEAFEYEVQQELDAGAPMSKDIKVPESAMAKAKKAAEAREGKYKAAEKRLAARARALEPSDVLDVMNEPAKRFTTEMKKVREKAKKVREAIAAEERARKAKPRKK